MLGVIGGPVRLSIHFKFFVVLLAFSLGPIFISRTFMGRAVHEVTLDMADGIRKELLDIVSQDIEESATVMLDTMEINGIALRLAARSIGDQAGHYYSRPPVESDASIYYTSDFVDSDLMPPDSSDAHGYTKVTRTGQKKPMMVSYEAPAIHLPLYVKTNNETIHRLLGLTPEVKKIFKELPRLPLSFNIGLESGEFMTYPGHGPVPTRYDHRDQDWYRAARNKGTPSWYQTLDPASREIAATIAYPIHDDSGTFIGAVALNIPVYAMMPDDELEARWESEVKTFLVSRNPEGDDTGQGLPILAHRRVEDGRRHWMSDIEQEWLTFDDPVGTQVLLHAMDKQDSGVVRLSFNNEPSVCAFAKSDQDFLFLLIVPRSVVSRLPNQVGATLGDLFTEMRTLSLIISAIMLVITGVIAWFGSRAIIRPVLKMTSVAKRLSKGDFNTHLNMRTGDERDDLISAFNDMGPKLKQLMELNRDMELAKEVQRLLLPHSEPCLLGYDISGSISYCDQTGGDYYDFIPARNREEECLGVVLGDVSGHGVPAAMVMAETRGQFHTLSGISMAPHERINSINHVLSRDLDGTGRFLTVFYLQLRQSESTIRWVRAGHDPAIRYNPATDTFGELKGDGIPLGVIEDYAFDTSETRLEDNEVLVMATDGVWEARNREGEMFGKERMLAIVKENAHKNAETLRRALTDAVEAFQANGQEDDIAVVVVKKTCGSDMPCDSVSFRMTNKENCFQRFQPEVESFSERHCLPPKVVFHLTLLLDELVTNIISYGYADYDEHPIDVTISIDGSKLSIRVEDDAAPFNILEAPEPELDVPLELREKPIGGMGIHLVKNMVHDITYVRENGKNVLLLKKDMNKACMNK